MKKGRILKILFTLIMVISFGKVKAWYNPGGGVYTTGGSGGGRDCQGATYCQQNNRTGNITAPALKLTLYYFDSRTDYFEIIGSPKYVSFSSATTTKLKNHSVSGSDIIYISGYSVGIGNYVKAYQSLRDYYGDNDEKIGGNINKNLKTLLNALSGGDYTAKLTKDTQNADPTGKNPAKYGYRIIIEPVVYYNSNTILTPIEAAYIKTNTSKTISSASFPLTLQQYSDAASKAKNEIYTSNGSKGSQAGFLFTSYDDVGIKSTTSAGDKNSQSNCDNISVGELADKHRGCGMNIIDIGKYIAPPPCYDISTKDLNGELTCKNKDKNNEASFTEVYSKRNCTLEESKKNTNTEDGKLIKELDNCSVYCKESAFASLPGKIENSLAVFGKQITNGSYFAWPIPHNSGRGMDMHMQSTYTCKIVQKSGKKCSDNDIKSLVSSAENSVKGIEMGAKLTAGDNRPINGQSLIVQSGAVKFEKSNTNLSIDSKTGKSSEFKVSITRYFMINENTNRYVNRTTGEASSNKSEWSNALDREAGYISLKLLKEPTEKTYDLKLSDFKLGSGNEFGKKITNYVCSVKTKYDCVCPSNTLNEGSSLYKYLTEGKTCAELQKTYCGCRCQDDPQYAEWDLDLTDKLSDNPTTKECDSLREKFCYKKTCTTETGKEIPITTCVDKKIGEGKKIEQAVRECTEETPECNGEKWCPQVTKEVWNKCRITEGKSYGTCYNDLCPYNTTCTTPPCYTCKTCNGTVKSTDQCISDRQEKYKEGFAEAQKKCNASICNDDCSSTEEYCPYTTKEAWNKCRITEGKSYGVCYSELCSGPICEKRGKCEKAVYRTIDLDNPFPADSKNGTTARFSNTGTLGRTPGQSWNSIEVVKDNILEARGVKGNKLYEKTPLYTIVLTPQTIKEIKAYNKGKSYNDFTLNCKNNDKTSACISDFIHTTIYSAINVNKSVANCYNMDKNEAGFKSCYEKNN